MRRFAVRIATAAVLAMPALPALAEEEAAQTVSCSDWTARYTSDPAVTHQTLTETSDPVVLIHKGGKVGELVLPAFSDAFDPEVFVTQGGQSRHVTSVGPDSIAWRMIGANWVDSLTFMGLDTDAPQLNWQRLRLSEDGPLETFLVATCTVS